MKFTIHRICSDKECGWHSENKYSYEPGNKALMGEFEKKSERFCPRCSKKDLGFSLTKIKNISVAQR